MTTNTDLQITAVGHDHIFRFKSPRCPYCGGQLVGRVTGWSAAPKLSVSSGFKWCTPEFRHRFNNWLGDRFGYHHEQADEIDLECVEEPDIESDEWEAWWKAHSEMPYVYWLPVEFRILGWINRHYVFADELAGTTDNFQIPAATIAG